MKKVTSLAVFFLLAIALINGCSKSEDTIINSSGGNRFPTSPSSPNPSNGQLSVSGFVTATWTCTDPDVNDTLRYDVVAGISNPPSTPVATNTLNRAADIGVGSPNTTYYWRVTAKDNHGGTTVGPVWSYKTAP